MPDTGFPRLSKAPIAEAAIELRAVLAAPASEAVFVRLREQLKHDYPTQAAIRFIASHLHIDSDTQPRSDTAVSLIGVRLESVDKKTIIQAKTDGLTVSRLQPYESWEALIAEVRLLWSSYVDIFAPTDVVRLGVRYINHIPLVYVDGKIDLDTVFTAAAKIPPDLPQLLDRYSTQIVMPITSHNAVLALTQALDLPGGPGPNHALLDIDASTNTSMKPDDPDVWHQLAKLREVKNKAFFGSLQREIWESFI